MPIFERRIGELQQLKDQLAKATSEQQKRTSVRGAKEGAAAFNSQVEAVLDTSQKSEWRELRAQTREKVKERYEQNQQSAVIASNRAIVLIGALAAWLACGDGGGQDTVLGSARIAPGRTPRPAI